MRPVRFSPPREPFYGQPAYSQQSQNHQQHNHRLRMAHSQPPGGYTGQYSPGQYSAQPR